VEEHFMTPHPKLGTVYSWGLYMYYETMTMFMAHRESQGMRLGHNKLLTQNSKVNCVAHSNCGCVDKGLGSMYVATCQLRATSWSTAHQKGWMSH